MDIRAAHTTGQPGAVRWFNNNSRAADVSALVRDDAASNGAVSVKRAQVNAVEPRLRQMSPGVATQLQTTATASGSLVVGTATSMSTSGFGSPR